MWCNIRGIPCDSGGRKNVGQEKEEYNVVKN